MLCNEYGNMVWACWRDLPNHYKHIELDSFVVMPNHIHAIIFLYDHSPDTSVGDGLRPSPTTPKRHGLPEIVRALKSFSARRINEKRGTTGQRSYHDRIIRHESELNMLRQYILSNPARWRRDRFYSAE